MIPFQFFTSLAVLAAAVSATPPKPSKPFLQNGPKKVPKPASGCSPVSMEKCCVPEVCICLDGFLYEYNIASEVAGGNGCDPPWGFITKNVVNHPAYCCKGSLPSKG
ncbi:hypothetical protein ED733_003009 [Metarhizium rileyi]|uniref:Hydrophobin n=1 Tax=Metarhizium rileyi (strain RCEF 4871) TaxID=1649241 RepID=A0A5C6GEX7_METRR|nr:hypothetical protein ED733_003009 [Metarhizium rileyi]